MDAHSGGGGGDTSNLGASIAYDSNTKKIELRNADGETLSEIDATAFVKDGMLDLVTLTDGILYFVFNTDAGKETISVPLSDFFDASQYYTKSEINRNYYTKKEIEVDYYSKTQIENKGYCTEAEVNANHYTKAEIEENYCTKTEINDGYYNKSEIDANHYTKTEIDANHYTKTEINNGYYPKSEIDGGYIANASYNNATNTLTLSSRDGSKQIDLDLS